MLYIFNFRYKPNTDLLVLNEFIKLKKLKWQSRNVMLNGDIKVKFVSSLSDFNIMENDILKIKNSGVSIDSIERDNGMFIICENLLNNETAIIV